MTGVETKFMLKPLKPQDIVLLLKTLSLSKEMTTQNKLAMLLCMSVSEINAGTKRLVSAGLLVPIFMDDKLEVIVNKSACEECLIFDVKYFFPVQLGEYTRGIATSYTAPVFEKYFVLGHDPIPVWPYEDGDRKGLALEPLYSSVSKSIVQYPDQFFYEMLVLINAIRNGRVRERDMAIKLLREKIHGKKLV